MSKIINYIASNVESTLDIFSWLVTCFVGITEKFTNKQHSYGTQKKKFKEKNKMVVHK